MHQVAWNLHWLNNMFWTSNTRLELHLIKRHFACSNLTEIGKKQPCFIVSRKRDPTWAIASAGTDDWNAKNSPLQVKEVYLANLKEDNYDNLFNLLKKGRRSWRAGITLKKEIFTTLGGATIRAVLCTIISTVAEICFVAGSIALYNLEMVLFTACTPKPTPLIFSILHTPDRVLCDIPPLWRVKLASTFFNSTNVRLGTKERADLRTWNNRLSRDCLSR